MDEEIELRRLSQRDLCGAFRSGNKDLDRFFSRHAKPNDARGLSSTWVAVREEQIVGFATVVPASIEASQLVDLVEGLPRYPAPVLLLARMATSVEFQGQRLVGPLLLARAVFPTALRLRSLAGCTGVFTDAKEGSVAFYSRFGFAELGPGRGSTTRMFLPISACGDPTVILGSLLPQQVSLPLTTAEREAPVLEQAVSNSPSEE